MMMNDNNNKYYLVKYADTDKNTILIDVFKKVNGRFVNIISNDPLDSSKTIIFEYTMIGNTLSCFISSLAAQYHQKCIDDIDTFDKKAYHDSSTLFNGINYNPFINPHPFGNPFIPYSEYMNIMSKKEKSDMLYKKEKINFENEYSNLSNNHDKLEKDLRDTFGEPTEEAKKRFNALFDPSDRDKYMKKKFDRITDDIFFPVVPGGYIDLNGNDVEYEKSTIDKNWKYLVRFCRESETFIITATGGEKTGTYAFVDANYHILQKADLNETYDKEEIIAPKNSMYLIVNSKNAPLNVVKK